MEIRDDAVAALSLSPRSLPPKYFYNETGAALVDRITELPEYYPTRTELQILEQHGEEIAGAIGLNVHLIEFGSGSGLKTRMLLRALPSPIAYSPVDISREQLIGLLRRVHALAGAGGGLLIGVDLHKDPAILNAAYNDADGVTAAFNLHVLTRLNRELGTDFDLDAFEHRAFYDVEKQRIEMRLLCVRACTVTIPGSGGGPGRSFDFAAGDPITTEYSNKYAPEAFESMAEGAGWRPSRFWTDARGWFGVWLLHVV